MRLAIKFVTVWAVPGDGMGGHEGQRASTGAPREGMHAGISYRVEGSGPALVLLPFFLAPSQWVPAVPRLARRFTVVTLGGRHLGGVAALEDRTRASTYRAMFRTLIDLMAPATGEAILDVGCGAGSLDRLLARRLGAANAIVAVDANPFLLREAALLPRRRASMGRSTSPWETPRRCRSPTNRLAASFRSLCSRSATPTGPSQRWCG